jgi:hypothetical protein
VPVPKPSPLAASAAAEPAKPAAQTVDKPAAEQQAAVAPAKSVDAAPATTATTGQAQAKPAAPSVLPTQDMPKAQGLD